MRRLAHRPDPRNPRHHRASCRYAGSPPPSFRQQGRRIQAVPRHETLPLAAVFGPRPVAATVDSTIRSRHQISPTRNFHFSRAGSRRRKYQFSTSRLSKSRQAKPSRPKTTCPSPAKGPWRNGTSAVALQGPEMAEPRRQGARRHNTRHRIPASHNFQAAPGVRT